MLFRRRFTLPLAAAALTVFVSPTEATLKYTKLEKRPCVTCHTSVQGKELNTVGKCYVQKKALKDCEKK